MIPTTFPVPLLQRVPVCDPDAIDIRTVGPLTVDLDAGDRFARTQDRLHNLFYLVSDLRDRLTDRPPDMVFNRNAANFRQVLIDHHIAAVGAEKGEADGSGSIYRLEVRCIS